MKEIISCRPYLGEKQQQNIRCLCFALWQTLMWEKGWRAEWSDSSQQQEGRQRWGWFNGIWDKDACTHRGVEQQTSSEEVSLHPHTLHRQQLAVLVVDILWLSAAGTHHISITVTCVPRISYFSSGLCGLTRIILYYFMFCLCKRGLGVLHNRDFMVFKTL